jgi:hypothetical protein
MQNVFLVHFFHSQLYQLYNPKGRKEHFLNILTKILSPTGEII